MRCSTSNPLLAKCIRHFEYLGDTVKSVEGDNAGWDLNATHRETSAVLKVEVKGLSGTEISIEMTPNEYSMMRKHKEAYRICVGTSCLKKSQRRLAVFSYNDKLSSWVDGEDRPLKLTEVKSARLGGLTDPRGEHFLLNARVAQDPGAESVRGPERLSPRAVKGQRSRSEVFLSEGISP